MNGVISMGYCQDKGQKLRALVQQGTRGGWQPESRSAAQRWGREEWEAEVRAWSHMWWEIELLRMRTKKQGSSTSPCPVCRSSAHASGYRSHGVSEAQRKGHERRRGRGSKNANDTGGQRLAEYQWKILGDARAGRQCKSENEGVRAPGRTLSVLWSKSADAEGQHQRRRAGGK
ncbi:hypothetical protein B0H13DRAFT_1891772 [Mycena leptocephala]|nr:hypothetical protein B0H13DRAFT_1891772 [Mycena leptocephala]